MRHERGHLRNERDERKGDLREVLLLLLSVNHSIYYYYYHYYYCYHY